MGARVNYQQRVLHAVMITPDSTNLMAQVLEIVSPDNFTGNDKRLFELLIERFNDGESIRLPDMVDLFPEDISLQEIIEQDQRIYAPTSVIEFAKEVKHRSQLRMLEQLGKTLTDTTKTVGTDVDELVSIADDYLLNVQKTGADESKSLDTIWTRMVDRSSRTQGMSMLGPSTTFPIIDSLTKGLQPQSYWVIGGQTNIGKSLFTQHLVHGALLGNFPVLIITLELSAEDVGYRLLGTISGVSLSDLYREGIETRKAEFEPFWELLHVNDKCLTLPDVLFAIKAAKRKFGVKLVVVDYIQNVQVPKAQNEYQALNEATLKLQRAAQINDCCIVCVSQLGRDSVKNKETDLFSFKGSGNLENSADIAIILHKDQERTDQLSQDVLKIRVVKNRLFGFVGSMYAFRDIAQGRLIELKGQNATPF